MSFWLTREQCELLLEDPNLPLQPAPPICVEIVSPSSTAVQMEEKRALYFATGAKEVWICEREGRLRFFDSRGEIARSHLVARIPEGDFDSLFQPAKYPRCRLRYVSNNCIAC